MSVLDDIMKKNNPPVTTTQTDQTAQGGATTVAPAAVNNGTPTPQPEAAVQTAPVATTVQGTTAPAPSTPAATTPVAQPQQLSYVDMLNKMYTPETAEQKAKRERKEKWDKTAAAIGDGISALANLYYTTKGAPNSYDGKNSMSERTRQLYEKLDKDRRENERWYLNHYMNAAKMDEDAKRYADERDYKRGRDTVADERYADERDYKRGRDKVADDRYTESIEHRNAREAVQDANTEWQHTFQTQQAARQQSNANREYNLRKDAYDRQKEKDNQTISFALGGGRSAVLKKDDIKNNPHNVSYIYSKLPKEIRDQYATEPVYDSKGKPVTSYITDENGKRVPRTVMKTRKLSPDDMMSIIGEYVSQYPEVQEAWKEVGGEITASTASTSKSNDNIPPSRRAQTANNNDNVPPSRRK